MGWNCFRAEDEENPTGPRTIGQTLRQKFPRLYNMIQRVKEKGAPSRLKKRFRRRHRITPENHETSLQKQPGANIACTNGSPDSLDVHLRKTQSPKRCSSDKLTPAGNTDDPITSGCPRDSVSPVYYSDDNRPTNHSSTEKIVNSSSKAVLEEMTSPMEDQLEIIAEDIVGDVLRRVVQPERLPSTSEYPYSNGSLDEMVDHLVENTLSRAMSSTSFDSPHRVILVKEFYDGDPDDKPGDDDQNVDGGKGDVAGPDKEIVINKDPREYHVSPERETRDMLDKTPGSFGGSDSPVKRVLGQDDLLKLGLEISRRNVRLTTQHSFH